MSKAAARGPRGPQQRAGRRVAAGRCTLHNKLRNVIVSEVQREVLAGSFDGQSVLDVHALLSQAAAAVEALLAQAVAAPKRVALRGVLAQAGDAQEVLLVESDVIQAQAVPVSGALWFPADSLRERISALASKLDDCFRGAGRGGANFFHDQPRVSVQLP